jgi:hypothetical protein
MPSATDTHIVPVPREPIAENAEAALSSVLWQACRTEAETMWDELHRRLHADESRKAAFIDHIARDLMNKTTRKRRVQLLRQLSGETANTDLQAA